MTVLIMVFGFAVTFTAVFGVWVAVARKQAAALEAQRELLAEKERKDQVLQAKADDIRRLNQRLRMR